MEQSHDIKGSADFTRIHIPEAKKKDIGGFFGSMRPAVLFIAIVVTYMLVILFGAYIGHSRLLQGIKEPETAIETAVASVLGLLAFILGFTFSLTWSRFANRNVLVIQHAKAIGLCYLRAGLIPEKQKLETRRLLQEYAIILIGIQTAPELHKALARINEIHLQIWQETVSLVREDMDSELRSLFTSSVNDLVSLALERKTIALFIRIPDAIWRSLLFLAFISMLAFGYQAGVFGISKLFQLLLLPIAFGLVMVLIADLNSQESQRHFKVTKRPLTEVLEMMEKPVA